MAWNVAQQYQGGEPRSRAGRGALHRVALQVPRRRARGLGEKAEGDEFAVMEQLERLTRIPAPKNLRGLRERPVRHTTVLDREEMLPFVLEKAQEKKWF